MNYSKFQKQGKNKNIVTTSINITKEQKALIEKYNINLSSLVRDRLNELIEQVKNSELEDLKKQTKVS